MHIPDGYLSPSTCACLYGASLPCWYVSLRRIKATLHTRTVPLLSVFAAFSFVIMMFNLPLPGGTTGHAVGMGIAAVVLGPAVSIVAISLALLIQALFFGDGGITAYGANCFNMAIVGSLSAFCIYRTLAWKAQLASIRRVIAAGLAGYGAINIAAFCAAVEFGIQPLLFHDASGAPLYAPYPLSVSIPAMMIGHLTLAGFAELFVSAGLVTYLQRTDLEMLRLTAPDAPHAAASTRIPSVPPLPAPTNQPHTARGLWVILATLLLLTPMGIVAVGSAWGEWSPADFQDASLRKQISSASRHQPAPMAPPPGLQRLYSFWKAPMAGYAPAAIRNPSAGYLGSALVGVALILTLGLVLRRLLSFGRVRNGFVERTLRHLIRAMQKALFAEETALRTGFLQALDPRVKLAGTTTLILITVATPRLTVVLSLFCLAVLLALASRISIRETFTRVWLGVLAFTGLLALPALFFTPGSALSRVPLLGWPITEQGFRAAAFLLSRAETTATLALLLIVSTLWTHLLRALRSFKVPAIAIVLAAMTYRYIFVFLQTAFSMLEARQVKLVGRVAPAVQRRLATASIGVLLDRTMQLSTEVHTAMQARGFRGEVHVLEDLRMRPLDWVQLAAVLVFALLVLALER